MAVKTAPGTKMIRYGVDGTAKENGISRLLPEDIAAGGGMRITMSVRQKITGGIWRRFYGALAGLSAGEIRTVAGNTGGML